MTSNLQSLIDIFKSEILHDKHKKLQEKYWIIVELQTKLKNIFMHYHEYELFRFVLQDYYNGLQKKLNPSRFKKFKKSSSSSFTRNKHVIYNNNTPMTKTKTNRYRFGEPLTDPKLLEKSINATFLFSLPQENVFVSENYTEITERKLNCDFDYFLFNNELYDMDIIPYVGTVNMDALYNYYMYMKHGQVHGRNNTDAVYSEDPGTELP